MYSCIAVHAVQSSNINLPQNPHEIHVMNGKKRPLQWSTSWPGSPSSSASCSSWPEAQPPETGRIVAMCVGVTVETNEATVILYRFLWGEDESLWSTVLGAAVQFQVGYMGMGQNPGT